MERAFFLNCWLTIVLDLGYDKCRPSSPWFAAFVRSMSIVVKTMNMEWYRRDMRVLIPFDATHRTFADCVHSVSYLPRMPAYRIAALLLTHREERDRKELHTESDCAARAVRIVAPFLQVVDVHWRKTRLTSLFVAMPTLSSCDDCGIYSRPACEV